MRADDRAALMADVQASISIERSADDILEHILDVEAYQAVDPRLRTIRWVRRTPGCTVFRFRPRLMGLPAPLSTQMVVRRGNRVDISALPSPNDRLVVFAGSMECREEPGSTTVTRRLRLDPAPALRPLLDRRLTRWLEQDVPAELVRLREALHVAR